MWFLVGSSKRTRRIKGGRKERAFCPDCAEETTFVEVEVEEAVQLFMVDVVSDKERAFRCVDCDAVGQLADTDAVTAGDVEDLSAEAATSLRNAQVAERVAAAKAEQEQFERQKREREANADQELLELKARMGLGPAPDANKAPANSTTDDRPWWRPWRKG